MPALRCVALLLPWPLSKKHKINFILSLSVLHPWPPLPFTIPPLRSPGSQRDNQRHPASLASSPLCRPPPQVAKGPLVANVMTNGIRILDVEDETREQEKDKKPVDAMMEADEEMARKLQAKMAAQEYGRARWGRGEESVG